MNGDRGSWPVLPLRPAAIAAVGSSAGAGMMPAARTGSSGRQVRLADDAAARHQAQDVEDARRRTRRNRRRRRRSARRRPPRPAIGDADRPSQQAVDRVGLAADFGRDPAGEHGDEARRPHQQRRAVQPGRVVKPRRAARHRLHRPSASISEADADHDAEAPEHDRRVGPLGPAATRSRPAIVPFQSWVRIRLPSFGISIA